jgi:hypothetical protein
MEGVCDSRVLLQALIISGFDEHTRALVPSVDQVIHTTGHTIPSSSRHLSSSSDDQFRCLRVPGTFTGKVPATRVGSRAMSTDATAGAI